MPWDNVRTIISKTYVCGYCGDKVGPDRGYYYVGNNNVITKHIYECSSCRSPTFFDEDGKQWPGVPFGSPVGSLPERVGRLYEEARRCMSVSAYTAAVMACRKLLMNIAVHQSADKDQTFKYYVEWLVEHHYVPPGGDAWVDRIRATGGEANHEIELVGEEAAKEVLSFTELLLKFVFEFPARVAPPDTEAPS